MMRKTMAAIAVSVAVALGIGIPAASAKPTKEKPAAQIKALKAQVAKLKRELAADQKEIADLKAPKPTTPPPAPTTTVPAVIFHQSGSGTSSTQAFHVPATWQLHWSYDCSSTGSSGNFMVNIDAPGDTDDSSPLVQNTGVNELGTGGSGVEHYYIGNADAVLSIVSECAWTVQVTP